MLNPHYVQAWTSLRVAHILEIEITLTKPYKPIAPAALSGRIATTSSRILQTLCCNLVGGCHHDGQTQHDTSNPQGAPKVAEFVVRDVDVGEEVTDSQAEECRACKIECRRAQLRHGSTYDGGGKRGQSLEAVVMRGFGSLVLLKGFLGHCLLDILQVIQTAGGDVVEFAIACVDDEVVARENRNECEEVKRWDSVEGVISVHH